MSTELLVVRESEHELVAWKPAGLPSELPNDPSGLSLKGLVARRHPGTEPKLPHRLDRVSCGLLLVCLSDEAVAFHSRQIETHQWEKYYLARVAAPAGKLPAEVLGEHKAFLVEENGVARLVRAGGKPSRLEILAAAPVPQRPDRWHLVIRLMTGRFHQIRVMCAALGLPLAGDPLYDPGKRDAADFYLEHIILKYTAFDTRAGTTLFRRECPERGALLPEIGQLLDAIALREVARPC